MSQSDGVSETDADSDADEEIIIETPANTGDQHELAPEFADIPGYDSSAVAEGVYYESNANTVEEFRRTKLLEYLLEQQTVAFHDVTDSDTYPGDGLVSINDAGTMFAVRIDEVAKAIIIETGDSWIALEPDNVPKLIKSLQMADQYLETDE